MFSYDAISESGYSDLIPRQVDVTVSLTGVSATASLGDETVVAKAVVEPTGVSATGAVGDISLVTNNIIEETGLEATGAIGDSTVVAKSVVDVTGVSTTGSLGAETVVAKAVVEPTGVEGTTALGEVIQRTSNTIAQEGFEATTSLGDVVVTADANTVQTGLEGVMGFGPQPQSATAAGDASVSTTESKFDGTSLALDGTGDYVSTDAVVDYGSNGYTVDLWANPANDTQDAVIFDARGDATNLGLWFKQDGTSLLVYIDSILLFTIPNVFSTGTWSHVAVTNDNPTTGTYRVFVDGTEEDSTTQVGAPSPATVVVGADYSGTNNWAGYVDEVRVSTVDRYNGVDFTPETTAYTADETTPVLFHFGGDNGSTSIVNSGIRVLTTTGDTVIDVTGLQGTTSLGAETVTADANYGPTGVVGTIGFGSDPAPFSAYGDAQISDTVYKFGDTSLALDGTGDYVRTDTTYTFGGEPFTVDFWARPSNVTQDAVIFDGRGGSATNPAIWFRQDGTDLVIYLGDVIVTRLSDIFSADTWAHIVGMRSGNVVRIYINGVDQNISAINGGIGAAGDITVGADYAAANPWAGYVDEVRVSNVARYTPGTNFTPETTAYTVDNSTPVLLQFGGTDGSTTITNSGYVSNLTFVGDSVISVTGFSATASLGSETVTADAVINPTGLSAVVYLGAETVIGPAVVRPTGVVGTMNTPRVTMWGILGNNAPVDDWTDSGSCGGRRDWMDIAC